MRSSLLVVAVLAAATPAAAQRPNQGEDESAALVDEGRAALKKGALDDAAKALDQAIALNPRRVEAYVLRSAVFAARKEYKRGIELMERARGLAPNDEEVLTALGSQYVLSGDGAQGVPILEQVTKKNPNRYDAQLLLGHYWHDSGKWPDSITAFEAYFAHRPNALAKEDNRHRIDLADAYLRFRQPQKALPLFTQAADARRTDVRARIGVAWATAAIDCKRARSLLRELEVIADTHPEIWLVDGQCALALGDTGAALERGRRYLEKAAKAAAAGHALVGEAQAAKGNLAEARKELESAMQLEPQRRRWTVRLSFVLRRANEPKVALAALDKLGPPTAPGIDPDWYAEVGEALLASGDAKGAADRMVPVLGDLPEDALLRTIAGQGQLAAGDADAAIKTLGEAETLGSTPRSRRLLSEALVTVAAKKLDAKDAAGAEPMLARADQLEGNAIVWRNLGVARLALDKPADAVVPLDKAAKADASAVNLMLAGRAHTLANDFPGARPLYDRALAAADKDLQVEVALDWAASELAAGDATIAVTALEKATPGAKGAAAARLKAALATARHAAGVAMIKAGNGTKAVELLKASVAADPALSTKCDLALAAVMVGEPTAALAALKAVQGQSCPFPAPADLQAAPILSAFTEGRNPKRASKALDKLQALAPKATGAAAALLGTSIRVVALEAAQDAYKSGSSGQARRFLNAARAANSRVGTDEVAHNLAVLDLADGNVDAAIAQLEKVAGKVPEALVNLGIAYERKGDPVKALDAWRRARKAGVRFPQLAEWIESKERVYGEAP